MVTSKKRSIRHVSAFIYILSISIRQHFLRHGIFSYLLWYHSPQTEQNAMKNPLSSFGSSSKNGTRHLQYNGKRCVTSFPRLTCFVCCGNGVIFHFPTVLIDVSSLHFGCKFFVQAYDFTRYRLQKLLQKFRNHTHLLVAAPLLKLCEALHLHFFLNVLFA